jgi:hypothetical protein
MGTDYYFKCDKCGDVGGWMSRQAWGIGNCDMIKNFKFCMWHTLYCGGKVFIVREQTPEEESGKHYWLDKERYLEFLKQSDGIFPRSRDWNFMDKYDNILKADEAWIKKEIENIERGWG